MYPLLVIFCLKTLVIMLGNNGTVSKMGQCPNLKKGPKNYFNKLLFKLYFFLYTVGPLLQKGL